MKVETFYIRESSPEWLLISSKGTKIFLMREEAVMMAIKAASISANLGNRSRVVIQDAYGAARVFWSSKLRNPAGADHRNWL